MAKIFEMAVNAEREGREASTAAILSSLEENEARHLTGILSAPLPSSDTERELEDYIKVIKEEKARTSLEGDDRLIEALNRKRDRKG